MITSSNANRLYHAPFAAITEKTDILLRSLPPAAGALWRELRRRTIPDRSHEFNLNELADILGYSVRWLRSALNQLQETDLVVIDRKWWGAIFSAKILDPGIEHKTSHDLGEPSVDCTESSKIEGSNTDCLVVQDLKENLKEPQSEPTTHPVIKVLTEEKNQEEQQVFSEWISLYQAAEQTVTRFGIQLNSTIQKALLSTVQQQGSEGLERIQDAAHISGIAPPTRRNGEKTNREALFMKALKNGWKPRPQQVSNAKDVGPEPLPASEPCRSPTPKKAPEGFTKWFELAKKIGLALGSMQDDEGFWIYTCSGTRELWEEMQKLHPIAELQEMAQRQATPT